MAKKRVDEGVRRMLVEHGPATANLPRFFGRGMEDRSKYMPRLPRLKPKRLVFKWEE